MVGLLALPCPALPSQTCVLRVQWRHTDRHFLGGLQLQVQLRTLTGFPCIADLQAHDCHVSAAKITILNDTALKSPQQLTIFIG